ncbi:unnamed protein product [Absidia cylindrospora]
MTLLTSVYATPFTNILDDEDDQDTRIPVTLIPVDDIDYDSVHEDIPDDDDDVMCHVCDGEDGGNDDGDNMHLDNDDEDDQVIPKTNPRLHDLARLLKPRGMHVIQQRLLRGKMSTLTTGKDKQTLSTNNFSMLRKPFAPKGDIYRKMISTMIYPWNSDESSSKNWNKTCDRTT